MMLAQFKCHGTKRWVRLASYDDAPRVLAEQMATLLYAPVPDLADVVCNGDAVTFWGDHGFIAELVIDPETVDCRLIAAKRAAPSSIKERQITREDNWERCRKELAELHRSGVSRVDAIRIFKGRRSSGWVNKRWHEKDGQDTGGFIG